MELNQDELLELIAEASHRLHSEIKSALKRGSLEYYLEKVGMSDLIPNLKKSSFESFSDGIILVIGGSQISDSQIYACFKSVGIDKNRVELLTDYSDTMKYEYNKLQYNPKYRLVLIGPVPHSVNGVGNYSNIISKIQMEDGFPRVIKLTDDHKLKITKSGLKKVLEEQINVGFIRVNS